MTDQENAAPRPQPSDEYQAGQRSITQRRGPSRFEIVREKKRRSLKGRPYIIGGIVLLLGLLVIPTVAFINTYVMPPRALAIRVGDVEYTRGDVVDLIRFNQRLSEELGVPFQLGTSVFDVLEVIRQAELSYQVAPKYGVTVSADDVNERIDFILGLVADSAQERQSEEFQVNREEAKRQFLNRVGLPEEVWRDFITKIMFQERLREYVGASVPRIQPQVHVYEIILGSNDPQTIAQIDRELQSGTPTEEVVVEFSEDFNARRTRGDRGWIPKGMLANQYDRLLYGTNEDGTRILPLRTASPPQFDSEKNQWTVLVIDEYQEARELNQEALDALTDTAFTVFLNEERQNYDLFVDLDSDIANWVNKQVELNAIAPTPGAATPNPYQGLLPDGATIGGVQPTAVPTPDGIPGVNIPVN